MQFTLHAPPPQLADSVKAIWCARGTKPACIRRGIRECQQLTGQTPERLKTTERSLAGLMRNPAAIGTIAA